MLNVNELEQETKEIDIFKKEIENFDRQLTADLESIQRLNDQITTEAKTEKVD